ncbi:hypothetical protein K503DRAFT_586599 [Rhizopogon vinicolor AM-OR11-026]|uniref:Uncharacterized protein n=1 Tax=Rhizopogon vinicolor AM-OR11-026 TaxID=1314800 RepID=A0A1B7MJE6_9AGAM|nr:hypothetical protein K503DRAFT_586599 [Rhizopogon vinicolor AM-OR11-026]
MVQDVLLQRASKVLFPLKESHCAFYLGTSSSSSSPQGFAFAVNLTNVRFRGTNSRPLYSLLIHFILRRRT